jgi:transcriptional regulator of acetoin/glycerol metabolism
MSLRYLAIADGPARTRLLLPTLGRLILGSGPKSVLELEGLLPEHAEILIDHEVSIRLLGPGPRTIEALSPDTPIPLGRAELTLCVEDAPSRPLLFVGVDAWARAVERLQEPRALRVSSALEEEATLEALAATKPVIGLKSGRSATLLYAGDAALLEAQATLRSLGARISATKVDPRSTIEATDGGPAIQIAHRDPKMLALDTLIDRAAASLANLVISGETGTGKDVVAQEIIRRSGNPRAVRTSAVALADAEALRSLLAEAEGGFLIVDEVTALSPNDQLALAHGLDAAESKKATIRVLSLASESLERAVADGRFRKELAYRLEALTVSLPPLRERRSEIVARAFAAALGTTIDDDALAALEAHDFPGNVRELKNSIGRAHLTSGGAIAKEHLPKALASAAPEPATDARSLKDKLAEIEKARIVDALAKHKTQREAAIALEMPMSTFLARLDAYGIQRARGGGKKPSE